MTTPALASAPPGADAHGPDEPTASRDDSITARALAARAGDRVGVDRFVRALHRDVQCYVAHLCHDAQAVDDVAQDTFLRARQPAPLRGPLHGPYLAAVHRAPRGDRQLPVLGDLAAYDPVGGLGDGRRTGPAARPARLRGRDSPPRPAGHPARRTPRGVRAHATAGLPYAEAAARSACPVGTVRSRVARARSALVRQLADTERDQQPASVPAWPRGGPRGTHHAGRPPGTRPPSKPTTAPARLRPLAPRSTAMSVTAEPRPAEENPRHHHSHHPPPRQPGDPCAPSSCACTSTRACAWRPSSSSPL